MGPDDAEGAFSKVMNIISEWFGRWKTNRMTGRGVFLLRLGHYDKALALLLKVIERDPENHMAWTAKGLTLAKQGKYKPALDAYERALRLQPPEKEREQLKGLIKTAKGKLK